MTFSLISYYEYTKFKDSTLKYFVLVDILHVIKVKKIVAVMAVKINVALSYGMMPCSRRTYSVLQWLFSGAQIEI